MKIMKRKVIVIIAIIIVLHSLALGYFLLFKQYFQQDEWHSFGLILSLGRRYITLDKSILELLLGDRVVARVIAFNLFNRFGLNSLPYGLLAFLLHIANTFLVFKLARQLTKNFFVSLLSGLFFLINEVGHEAYTWFGTMSGSATAVFFFLLSLIFYLRFIKTKKYLLLGSSLFLLWFSFLFKETAVFAFILYPIIFWFFFPNKGNKIKWFFKTQAPLSILAIIMLLFFTKTVLFIPGERANYVETGSSLVPSLFFHTLQYSSEGIIQTLLPSSFIFILSDIFTRIFSPHLSPDSIEFLIAVQNINAEIMVIILLAVGSGAVIWLLKRRQSSLTNQTKRALLISLMMTILSFLPYIVLNRSFAYLDSRHYYPASIGASLLLAIILVNLLGTKTRPRRMAFSAITGGFIILHLFVLYSDFWLLAKRADERKSFLQQVQQLVPELPKKAIFYVTGDAVGYYGLPELKVPFQSGPGHVLMVSYSLKNQLSPAFFEEKSLTKALDIGFLYDILGQDYREIDGQGFGYYYDENELKKVLEENKFSQENIISLYYFSEAKELALP